MLAKDINYQTMSTDRPTQLFDKSGPIRTIEWEMINKSKFYPLSMASTFTMRFLLHPLNVIKTRIQVQHQDEVYKGTIDAFKKIYRQEGFFALYKGFWISTVQLVSGAVYITTYETVRHFLHNNDIKDSQVKALIAGGCASVTAQTIMVPFDIISQHTMVLGMESGKNINSFKTGNLLHIDHVGKPKVKVIVSILKEVYRRDGFIGFYRGYFASLGAHVPSSALWWLFYHFYQDQLEKVYPIGTSSLLLQFTAAPLGGLTTTVLTSPLDTIRTRLQVHRSGGYFYTLGILWKEDRMKLFTKGLSPRIIHSVVFSGVMILCYELVKRISAKEEYKSRISW